MQASTGVSAEKTTDKNPIQVAEKIFGVIECMSGSGPMGLMEISNAMNLNKTTVHRILNSLICMDYVHQDPETSKYTLSFKFCNISSQILSQNSIIDFARPYLKELSNITGETVHLVEIDGINAVYIDKVDSAVNSVRLVSKVGKSIPLYCSGVGKALLAEMSNEEIASIWNRSELKQYTEHTILDYEEFLQLIAQIRKQGYAMDNEEIELGVRCVAMAIPDYHSKIKYAISVSAPKDRMTDERVESIVHTLFEIRGKVQNLMK